MDPVPNILGPLLNAIQGVQGTQAAGQALPAASALPSLLSLAGQEVAMQLLGTALDGTVSLGLPSGQVITAQGQMPYPEGTQLLVRVLAGTGADGTVRLQTLQASPPASPAILAPLVQGEAGTLLASLASNDPPEALQALSRLFQQLSSTGANAQAAPDAGRIQAAVASLPDSVQGALRQVLGLPANAAPAALADALGSWMAGAGAQRAPQLQALPQTLGQPQPQTQAQTQAFQSLVDRHPELPPGQGAALVQWFKELAGGNRAAAVPVEPGAATAANPAAGARLAQPADAPETWEAWIRGGVKALADPAVSPQAAPFHAAQAQEGTGFFELPLPWAPGQTLQMWLESDRDARDPDGKPAPTQRVLLGLAFSNLGETRVGIAKSGENLQVRVWTEHPEPVLAAQAGMESELRELGGKVDLKVLPLAPGPGGAVATIRGQIAGSGLQALG
jgi:hypothetical protein